MQTMRDSEVAAAVMGVDVRATKAGAFVLSSMYAGLGGVMLALAFGRLTPSSFDLALSVSYLAMIVIGGLGSIGGAAMGAVFVVSLPYLLTRFSGSIPFVAAQGSGGYGGSQLAVLAYGLAVIAFVLFEPGGLSALGRRLVGRRPVRALDPAPQPSPSTATVGTTSEENA
jgi:branched-chain amino acid transport system permease protein